MSVGTPAAGASAGTAVDVRILTRAELALYGVRTPAPVRRPEGAGPSDDGHVLVDGANAALPINPESPYAVRDGRVWLGDADTGLTLTPVRRPRFYDLATADGVPYEHIARLHGADVLNLWRPGEGEHETTYASANVGMRSAWLDPRADRAELSELLSGADGKMGHTLQLSRRDAQSLRAYLETL